MLLRAEGLTPRFSAPAATLTSLAFIASSRPLALRAQPGPPRAPTTQCSLRGQSLMPVNAAIVDASGQAIARFSGAATSLVASDFPGDTQGKVRVETGFAAGSFRIRDVDPSQLAIFTAANVNVAHRVPR